MGCCGSNPNAKKRPVATGRQGSAAGRKPPPPPPRTASGAGLKRQGSASRPPARPQPTPAPPRPQPQPQPQQQAQAAPPKEAQPAAAAANGSAAPSAPYGTGDSPRAAAAPAPDPPAAAGSDPGSAAAAGAATEPQLFEPQAVPSSPVRPQQNGAGAAASPAAEEAEQQQQPEPLASPPQASPPGMPPPPLYAEQSSPPTDGPLPEPGAAWASSRRQSEEEAQAGWYRVVGSKGASVRTGEEITSEQVMMLPESALLEIVEVRGRRGRLTRYRHRVDSSDLQLEGWVSLRNSKSHLILARVCDCGEALTEFAAPEPAPAPPATGVFKRLQQESAAGQAPRPWDLQVTIPETMEEDTGNGRRVQYVVHVTLRADQRLLWSVTRTYQEMADCFRNLRDIGKPMGKQLPDIPSEAGGILGRMAAFTGGSERQKRPGAPEEQTGLWARFGIKGQDQQMQERCERFAHLFNCVLGDRNTPSLSSYEPFTRLLGLRKRPEQWEMSAYATCTTESFDPRNVRLADDFRQGIADGSFVQNFMSLRLGAESPACPSTPMPALMQDSSRSPRPGSSPMDQSVLGAIDDKYFACEGPHKWTRLKTLGKGAFGTVVLGMLQYKAFNVAVKIIQLSSAPDEDAKASFEAEFRLMAQLQHPNIVQYVGHYFHTKADELHIFLEYLPGGSVASRVKEVKNMGHSRLPALVVRHYAKQVLVGLDYLHSERPDKPPVVHRDIKGENLLLTTQGDVKLADFGCSKMIATAAGVDPLQMNQTAMMAGAAGAQTMVGTPFWMAPEVISPQQHGQYGVKCDIWSLGCVIIEMHGEIPWADKKAVSPWEIMFTIAQAEGGPSNIPADISPKLKAFLGHCFHRDPRKRLSASSLLLHPYIMCPDDDLDKP
eukprot:TRINITY_DN10011_c0_g2_i4.p1 TRINITY_DN10011_c0_g2~~TRINITY_DN10011_c0_g2_i4.p1  ORF type:complete len:911 (+),score=251.02 TRINITY_DN10011_c0_g2_i4:75-2735(+)